MVGANWTHTEKWGICGNIYIYIYTGWWFQPLWKIWVRQLGWLFPIHGKIIQMFQTTNQIFIYIIYPLITLHMPGYTSHLVIEFGEYLQSHCEATATKPPMNPDWNLTNFWQVRKGIVFSSAPAGPTVGVLFFHCINIWLVVHLPLWKICVRQLGWLFPIYGKIKNLPNHQSNIFNGFILFFPL